MIRLCLLLLFSVCIFKAIGQAGSLDPGFGNKGIQTTGFLSNANTFQEQGRVVLTNTNGDIFVVAMVNSFTRVAKYLPDGRLDSSYGVAGYSSAVNLGVAGAALQGDKIVVIGSGTNSFELARFTNKGILDASFGVNGIVATHFSEGSSDYANAVILQGDKILVAGSTYNPDSGTDQDFALTRYTANGVLDASFGKNGLVITDFDNSWDVANSIVLQGDKIIVGGNNNNPATSNDFALVRYTANGVVDSSFGENGRVTTDFDNSYDVANAIALQENNIILLGTSRGDFILARYTANGKLDTSFGEDGKVTTDFNNLDDQADAIVVQGNKIIAAGSTGHEFYSPHDFALARYTANGTLDASFGVNGKLTTNFTVSGVDSSDDKAYAMALQRDKIIVAGSNNGDFALACYRADGALDASFGEQGLLTGHFPASQTLFTSTAIQGNKILAAGYALYNNRNNDFALVRYTVNGTLDSAFGVNGKVTTNFTVLNADSSDDKAYAITLQGDKIVLAGSSNGDFALARYTADGVLDQTFGVNGKMTMGFNIDLDGGSNDEARSIVLQGDKIVVGGSSNGDFALARYTADGRLDFSFGVNGKVTTDFNNSDDQAHAILLQGDKIMAAGYTNNDPSNSKTKSDFALARYTADGILDASFGRNGKVITDFTVATDLNITSDEANAIALQGDKIIVAGNSTSSLNGISDFALARYAADGSLDSSFGVNGRSRTDFDLSNDFASSMALRGDSIILAGNSNYNFALACYTADGAPDSSFGANGKTITALGSSSFIQSIALHENRLYAVGSTSVFTGETYGAVAAYQLGTPVPAEPTVSIEDVTVSESQNQAVLTLHLSAPSTRVVQVDYHTRYITAHSTRDYLSTKCTLQFAAGTTTAKGRVSIVNDSVCEPTEQFEMVLRNPQNATINDSIGIVTITDDDCTLTTIQQSSGQEKAQISTALSITASPNPSADAFTIQLHSSDLKQQVSIRVYETGGKLLERREHLSIGQILHLGDQYKAGTYMIEAVQGSQRAQTKVIKTGK
jgi:uncharacterized delta-60 repeat protein